MERREDVVIVGAGVIGLACALALLESGRGVRVIDAGRVGGGSSHGNCGTITPSHAPPLAAPGVVLQALRWMLTPDAPLYVAPRFDPRLWSWLLRFALRCNLRDWRRSALAKSAILNDSRQRLADWVRDYGLECEFAPSGEDYVYRDPREFEHGQGEVEFLRSVGVSVEVVDGPRYEAREPALKPGVAGAICFDGDAVLRPDRYVAELARVVRERGGAIDEHRALAGIAPQRDGVRIDTAQGPLQARDAVLALGAWSARLAGAIGAPALKRAIQPGKGYSITYTAPKRVPRRPLVLRDRSVCVTAWASGYRLGSTMEFSGFDDRLNRRRLDALERGAAEYLHEPVGAHKQEEWFGWRPMSCDDVPIIGPAPGSERVWLATGHGMMGVSMSAATGQLIADLVTGRAPAIDPAPFRIERFG
ncbi:NAD(P)/FAD-dependent oxidoreductase [Vulcaniibacterium tengchongense]|uniref:D-amino acid dehydrogenase small subunit n=1 Tax=Vulcaniibacterium tengchongense TaxID=1273429 RepID=A0A3N4V2J8_9GAMM|nr:FAD-dependent oxidoreductase [Vulcaniibacterium tengchongense]RPE77176.1 D-amino acid dehydrogenase small subunit [Vulcaniibacterium tengchongense]